MAAEDDDKPENDKPDDDDADDDTTGKGGDDDDADDEDDDDSGDDSGNGKKKDPELEKAIKRRDRVLRENRRLKAELEAASKKKTDDDEPDPVAEANTKIVRTAAHGILRGLGIEEKEDRIAVLDLLRLDDVTVDGDGADEDEIEERIENLRSILGAKKTAGRVPRTVKTNRQTKDTNADPDAARYRRIMGGSR